MYIDRIKNIREKLREMILDEISLQLDGDFDITEYVDQDLIADAVSERIGNAVTEIAGELIDEVADEVFDNLI